MSFLHKLMRVGSFTSTLVAPHSHTPLVTTHFLMSRAYPLLHFKWWFYLQLSCELFIYFSLFEASGNSAMVSAGAPSRLQGHAAALLHDTLFIVGRGNITILKLAHTHTHTRTHNTHTRSHSHIRVHVRTLTYAHTEARAWAHIRTCTCTHGDMPVCVSMCASAFSYLCFLVFV